MDDKQNNGDLKEGLDQIEQVEIDQLSDGDLETAAGGDFCSLWCCSGNLEDKTKLPTTT